MNNYLLAMASLIAALQTSSVWAHEIFTAHIHSNEGFLPLLLAILILPLVWIVVSRLREK